MRRVWTMVITILLGAALLGCGNYTEPEVEAPAMTPAQRNFEAYWQASMDVLRKYRFRADRKDRREGIIITHKMLAGHWFEFWRPDAVTFYDFAEGTLQTVHRRAEVRIEPMPGQAGRFRPRVRVEVSYPESRGLEMVGAGEAYGAFLDTEGEIDHRTQKRRRRIERVERERRRLEGTLKEEPADEEDVDRFSGTNELARTLAEEIHKAAVTRLGAAE